MKFDNEKTVDKLQALKKIYAILVLSFISILYSTTWELYTIKYLGLSRLAIAIILVVAYLLYYFYHLFSKTSYFSYSEDDYKIIIRYYPLKSVTPKLSSIEIPKSQIYKYIVVKKFLTEGVVIYQKNGKQIAKYPSISITGLKKEEKQKLFDSLNQYVQEGISGKTVL